MSGLFRYAVNRRETLQSERENGVGNILRLKIK
jgi:hypothetical protein